jgi:hypothetical protein
MVVLYELEVDPQLSQRAPPVGLEKETTLVSVNNRFRQDRGSQVRHRLPNSG